MNVPSKQRLRKAIGPTTAMVATLREFDWKLLGPTEWIVPGGDHFRGQIQVFRWQSLDLHDLCTALAKSA
eukprot:1475191-Pyramimonas_sp.AAC.1